MKNRMLKLLFVPALAVAWAVVQPAEADWVVSYSAPVFYQDLSPHGSWFIMEPYGWVWQPQVVSVSAGWRPYCHGGAWLWTDYGWYWESSYSWGWIPFHFGWWVLSPCRGWVWVPGSYWAPAWVCWRSAPGYYGWAPLPPPASPGAYLGFGFDSGGLYFGVSVALTPAHYTFVHEDRVCEPALDSKVAPAPEGGELYAASEPCREFGAIREKAAEVLSRRPAVAATPQAQAFLKQNSSRAAISMRPPLVPAPTGAKVLSGAGGGPGPSFVQAPGRANQVGYRPVQVPKPAAARPPLGGAILAQQQRAASRIEAVRRTAPAVAERAATRVAAVSERAQALSERAGRNW